MYKLFEAYFATNIHSRELQSYSNEFGKGKQREIEHRSHSWFEHNRVDLTCLVFNLECDVLSQIRHHP